MKNISGFGSPMAPPESSAGATDVVLSGVYSQDGILSGVGSPSSNAFTLGGVGSPIVSGPLLLPDSSQMP